MLKVHCQEYLEEVRAFARDKGILDKLEAKLEYLATYGGDWEKVTTVLCKDFAPHSFGFDICFRHEETGKWRSWLVGGLIYCEGTESGATGPRWEAHT